MQARIEIRKVANDDPACSYLIVAGVGAGVCGVLFPSLLLSASDDKEALGLAGELLAMLPGPSASITGVAAKSHLPAAANSNSDGAQLRTDPLRASPQAEFATIVKERT